MRLDVRWVDHMGTQGNSRKMRMGLGGEEALEMNLVAVVRG